MEICTANQSRSPRSVVRKVLALFPNRRKGHSVSTPLEMTLATETAKYAPFASLSKSTDCQQIALTTCFMTESWLQWKTFQGLQLFCNDDMEALSGVTWSDVTDNPVQQAGLSVTWLNGSMSMLRNTDRYRSKLVLKRYPHTIIWIKSQGSAALQSRGLEMTRKLRVTSSPLTSLCHRWNVAPRIRTLSTVERNDLLCRKIL